MKRICTVLIVIFVAYSGFSQYVKMDDKPMSKGVYPGFSVNIQGLDSKVVAKEWQQFMKDYSGKSKRDRKSKELVTTGAAIGGIGGDVTVYGSAAEIGTTVQYTAWFESDAIFVAEDETTQSDIVVGIMERFIVHMKRVRIESELEFEEKSLKMFQKELNQEEKNEKKNHSDIAKFQKKIEEAEVNISESRVFQEQKTLEIERQQEIVEGVKVRLSNVGLEDEVKEKVKEMDAVDDINKKGKKKTKKTKDEI